MFGKKQNSLTPRQLEEQRIAREYAALAERLEQCRTNFNYATEREAIDALVYEENSILSRMAALLKQAKEAGYRAEPFNNEHHK